MYEPLSLDYNLDALDSVISGETMFIHYEKLYKRYLKRLNDLLVKNNFDFKKDIVYVIQNINEFNPEDRENILFNAGGVLNHELYFKNLSPKGSEPKGEILQDINKNFGSFSNFKEEFKNKANTLKGSGYTFLVLDGDKLKIMNFGNQDSPYMHNLIPIFNMDIWEHAYFLDYFYKKDEYINNFFKIVSFDKINEEYQKANNKL